MDQIKIGGLLKDLRKEKGITQEQLAEKFNVSNRTISRWETGNNLPDLSTLVELADFYDLDIKEIIDGERKSENMNSELKETLNKVADYSKMEKTKIAETANVAFGLTLAVCIISIISQLFVTRDVSRIVGETIILVIGAIAYLKMLVKNGGWKNSKISLRKKQSLISGGCGAIFSIILFAFMYQDNIELTVSILIVILLLVVTALVGVWLFFHMRKNGTDEQ